MSAPTGPAPCTQLLEPLAQHGVSMSRFESRPARTGLWEYLFFVDLVGHRDDAPVAAALAELAPTRAVPEAAGLVSRGTAPVTATHVRR